MINGHSSLNRDHPWLAVNRDSIQTVITRYRSLITHCRSVITYYYVADYQIRSLSYEIMHHSL